MIQREIITTIKNYCRKFPIIAVTGSRQSGKTTLLKEYFKDYKYYNLEFSNTLELFQQDLSSVINTSTSKIIIDEVQKFPRILNEIQAIVDEQKIMGSFVISGSQNLLLNQSISQSLAGRCAYIELPTLSIQEILSTQNTIPHENSIIFRGSYPAIFDRKIEPTEYYPSFVSSYIERDVREIKNIKDLTVFKKFLGLMAGRCGQLFNATSITNILGISFKTINEWISILEASYILFRLEPWFTNQGTRIVKSPKFYFYDTGLICNLLGLNKPEQLENHYLLGNLFENLIISEFKKKLMNSKSMESIYFFRNKNNIEIDLLLKNGNEITPIEIKKSRSFDSSFTKNINVWKNGYKDFETIEKPIILFTGKSIFLNDYNCENYIDYLEKFKD